MKKLISIILAAVLMAGVAGCGTKTQESGKGDTVKWYLFSNPGNVNEKDIFAEAQRMAKEKTGVDLEIIPIESGDYESKMQILTASNEPFDIMFTSNWLNNYYMNVSKNAILPLDDYLKDYPELYNSMPEYFWDSMKVKGKIYAVPNQQIVARGPFFAIPEQNMELLGFTDADFEGAGENYKTALAAVEKYLRAVKEKTGNYCNLNKIWNDGTQMFNIEEVVGSLLPGAIQLDNETDKYKLINQYESEEFKYYIKMRRKWVEEGLVMPSEETERDLDHVEDPTAIVPNITRGNCYKPNVLSELNRNSDYDWKIIFKCRPITTSGSVAATMNAISATSKNPEGALKIIQLVDTDAEFYNLLVYGLEGVNYTKTGENSIELNPDMPYTWTEWNVGNTFNKYNLPGEPDNFAEEVEKINDESFKSPLLGFSPDLDNVKVEVSACQSAVSEYLNLLDYGLVDVDSSYPEFIKKLKAAGCDKLISEVQRQVDEWVAQQ